MNVEQKLSELGYTLSQVPKPIASYVPGVRTGNLLYISGQLPVRDGKLLWTGTVPSVIPIETAQKAAAQCAVNALSILASEIKNDWSRFVRVVKVGAFIQSDNGFGDQATVANGASELLQQILGEAGRHARAAIGVNALPRNTPVEVEFIFEIRD